MTTDSERQEKAAPDAEDVGSPLSDIQDLVGDLVEGVRAFAPKTGPRFPRYDLIESGDEYSIMFDLPGVAREAIEIKTEGDQVIVSGDRVRPEPGDGDRVRRTERSFGPFRRGVRVPADVDLDGVRARLAEGVLTVVLPRRADQPGRKVDIEP
ncbi:MAG: Hsp20/alpha crystallin family protein [Gemmatimonadota bacterium]